MMSTTAGRSASQGRQAAIASQVTLLAGEKTVTFTYSVTVDDPAEGDGSPADAVVTPTGNCVEGSDDPGCSTTITPVDVGLESAPSVDAEFGPTRLVDVGLESAPSVDAELDPTLVDAELESTPLAEASPSPIISDPVPMTS